MTYTVNQIMQRYNVTQHTVLGWIARGELKAINVGTEAGKKKPRWRITQEALDAFEALRSTTPPPQPATRRRKRQSQVVEFY
jgi:hypothetical protein